MKIWTLMALFMVGCFSRSGQSSKPDDGELSTFDQYTVGIGYRRIFGTTINWAAQDTASWGGDDGDWGDDDWDTGGWGGDGDDGGIGHAGTVASATKFHVLPALMAVNGSREAVQMVRMRKPFLPVWNWKPSPQ